jgi:hypothetical protein
VWQRGEGDVGHLTAGSPARRQHASHRPGVS